MVPDDILVPDNDGVCDHLAGSAFSTLDLPTTSGSPVNLIKNPTSLTTIFRYPRTAAPHKDIPAEWNAIPGACGCTPQAFSFRNLLSELKAHGVDSLYVISTQSTEYHQEVKERLHLPYGLISDDKLSFMQSLNLPTLDWKGTKLVKTIRLQYQMAR